MTRRLAGPVVVLALAAAAGASAQAPPASPPFAWRGVVEGAYGRAWTHPQRVRLLAWMAGHGFDAYIHAPKSDRYEAGSWRTPYPAREQREMAREIASARAAGVRWIPNLDPARPAPDDRARLCFSCPGDLRATVAKLAPFLRAGSDTVMVSFDDVAERLGDPRDARTYRGSGPEAFGRANADFLDRLLDALRAIAPRVRLLTVASDYAGTADTPYLRGLRAGGLRPEIGVLWTGPTVRSSDFSSDDAAAYGRLVGRTPIVWENWANHDFTAQRLFLGPYRRSHDLTGAVAGFFFNTANEPDLNALPLATAGDWMRDPSGYSARTSWTRAVQDLAGGRRDLVQELRAFAETSSSSTLDPDEAVTFAARAAAFLTAYASPDDWSTPRVRLDDELALTERAASDLGRLPDPFVAAEAAPFLVAARQAAQAARAGVALLAAERPRLAAHATATGIVGRVTPPDPALAARWRTGLRARRRSLAPGVWVYGCRGPGRGCPVAPHNLMDAFLAQVGARDAAWRRQAPAAARVVRLYAAGHPVRLSRDGRFPLPPSMCGRQLVAVDGTGGRTLLLAPSCAPADARARRATA